MNRPSPPRLPELAGMTEAGFNRVVNMIDEYCFSRRHFCTASWTRVKGLHFCAAGCKGCLETLTRYNEWRTSLPPTRNKKQRKADAKREFFELAKSVPVVDGPLAARVDLLKGGG